MSDDEKWLRDCGWCGWMIDVLNGRVIDHHGQEWRSMTELRKWLQGLSRWPIASNGGRNIPKRSSDFCAPVEVS